jgi:tryptophan-rich sensory protein
MKNFGKLIISIVVCEVAGLIGSIFTAPAVRTWYPTLIKPSFKPPNWLFAPVWTALFLLMGIAMFLVWSQRAEAPKERRRAITIFFVQLFFNILWSIMFFGLKTPLLGFIVIIILWVLILATIIRFFKISKPAGWLLIPYILWVSFASILNLAILVLN